MIGGPAPGAERTFWCRAVSAEALAQARGQIQRRCEDPRQRALMLAALGAGRVSRYPERASASVHVPILCAAAAKPGVGVPDEVAAATVLLWTGLELYDDLTDGDLGPELRDVPDYEVVFTAFGLACLLPTGVLAEARLSFEIRNAMLGAISAHLLRAFAGQQMDLRHRGRPDVSAAATAAAVRGKNGEPTALFASLGAIAAGASGSVVAAYRRYGLGLGMVAQYQSDFWELFFDPAMRDLRQRNRTLQIAAALEHCEGRERRELLELLDRARTDASAREQVRATLRAGRHVAPWRDAVHAAAREGLQALESAAPAEPAGSLLRELVHERTPYC